jgi:hypothetical protein
LTNIQNIVDIQKNNVIIIPTYKRAVEEVHSCIITPGGNGLADKTSFLIKRPRFIILDGSLQAWLE